MISDNMAFQDRASNNMINAGFESGDPTIALDTGERVDLFTENMELDEDQEDEEEKETEADEEEKETEAMEELPKLGISREHARRNYINAGLEAPEKESSIRIEDFSDVMDASVEAVLEEVLEELSLPYRLAPFQRVGVVALGSGRHLVTVVGTGEGKMTIPLISALVARKIQAQPKGVVVITQPLTGLMMQQLENPICSVAVLSMSGQLTADTEDGGPKAQLSCSREDLLAGMFPVLLGHPESFASPLGQSLLAALQRNNQITGICIDEFHTNLHWSAFRPEMMRQSTGLRAFARKGATVCIMTATATEKEVHDVVKFLGLRSKPVMLLQNQVQDHIKLSLVRRPSNAYGLAGRETHSGVVKPGLWALLNELYFREFFRDLKAGRTPKRCIIFTRGMGLMAALHIRVFLIGNSNSIVTSQCAPCTWNGIWTGQILYRLTYDTLDEYPLHQTLQISR